MESAAYIHENCAQGVKFVIQDLKLGSFENFNFNYINIFFFFFWFEAFITLLQLLHIFYFLHIKNYGGDRNILHCNKIKSVYSNALKFAK